MVTKTYKQELEDLESGLRKLENMKPRRFLTYEKIRHAKDIQQARIDFFKRGYALKTREIREQKRLELGGEK